MTLEDKTQDHGRQAIIWLWSGIILFLFWILFICLQHESEWSAALDVFRKDNLGFRVWYELITDVMPHLCVVLNVVLALIVLFGGFRKLLIDQQATIEYVKEKCGMDTWWKIPSNLNRNWINSLLLGGVFGFFSVVGAQAGDIIDQKHWKIHTHNFFELIKFSEQERDDLQVETDKVRTEGVLDDAQRYNQCLEDRYFQTNPKCKVTDYANVGFRDTWSIVAGVVGGPVVGLVAGTLGGAYRELVFGGSLGVISFIATAILGLFTGFTRQVLPKLIERPLAVLSLVISATVLQRGILLFHQGGWKDDWQKAYELALTIGIPVMIINISGSVIFLWILSFLEKDKLELEKQRAEYEKDQFELQALRTQIQPHTFNNVLTNIQGLIVNNKLKEAEGFIVNLSDFYKKIQRNCGKPSIALKDELDLVNCYNDLQSVRFGEKIQYKKLDADNLSDFSLPPMCLFTLVENAFQHAFSSTSSSCEIKIEAREYNTVLELRVIDNGKGIPPEKLKIIANKPVQSISRNGCGIALFNLNKSLQLAFNGKATLVFESEIGRGTTVTITIPKGAKVC
jgi:signal transduction histidine kinase